MASTTPVAPAGELDQPVDLLSPQARKLWASYQSAAGTLGESLRDLGFVDLVVYGRQTTGKSSLLGALCGVQLPTGENQITKCPIRIAVSPSQQGTTLTAAGNPPQALEGSVVTAEIYTTALDLLSKGRVTHQEMTVCLGAHKDHPPLNLVDLPGLIPNTSDASSSDVETMVKDTLQNPATLPIIVLRAESDELATVRTELTGGKKFYAVATHLDLYDPERDVGRLVELAGKFKEAGCLGLFLVSVKGSQDKGEAWYDEFCSRCPDQALRARLRAMCGVGSLRTELQAVQLNHMLRNLPAITANLSRLLHQVAAKMDAAPKDEGALFEALHQLLGQTGQDLSDAVERGAWSVGSDESVAHHKHRLQERAHQVLRDFASRAEEQVLQALAAGWRSVDPESVMSSSHLSSEQTLAWNLMKPGLVKLRMEAEAASVRLLALQKSFLMWRAEKHLGHLGAMVLHAFGLFIDDYHTAKAAALGQILDHADETFKVVPPELYASAVYHALLESSATADAVKKYSKPLAAALEETQPMSTGHQPKFYEDAFAQHWTKLQRKSKLLAFERSTETINSLSGQMWMLIFTRSCRYMTMQPWQTSLAFAPLQPAFTRWVEGEGHDLAAWVDPEQQALAAERASLSAILAELKPFEMNAATLSQAPLKLPKKEPSYSSKPEKAVPKVPASPAPSQAPSSLSHEYEPTYGSSGANGSAHGQNGNGYIKLSSHEAPRTPPQDTPRSLDTEPPAPSSPWGLQSNETFNSFSNDTMGAPQGERKKSLGGGSLMNKFRSVSGRTKSRDIGQDKMATSDL